MSRPWDSLPPDALAAFAPHLPRVTDEIIATIADEVPAYARPLEGAFGHALRMGVEQALEQFVAMTGSPSGDRGSGRNVYRALGRGEAREGRTLEALLAAYRVGARVAWRRLAEVGVEAGLAPETLVLFAESIFAYIDELSAESAEGFAREQAERAGEADRHRAELLELLVRVPPAEPGAVAAAAGAAHWALPHELAIVVWPADRGWRPAARLPAGALIAPFDGLLCAVVGDPRGPGRRAEVERALKGTVAGMGSTVPVSEAGRSLRRATTALALAQRSGASGLLAADDHGVDLLCAAEPSLVDEFAARRLAPLGGETPASRERLEATLLAWLRHDGAVPAAATELHVHAQTVRYRLGRLRELLGPQLDDPEARLELQLALRSSRTARAAR